MLYASRMFTGTSNHVAGADFRLRLNDQWQATGQAVRSWSHVPETDSIEGGPYQALLTRAGRQFTYELIYNDLSPEFQTSTGFIPRVDYRSLQNSAHYYFRPEGKILVAWGPEFSLLYSWDHNATRLDSSYHPVFYVEMQRRTFL